MDVTIKKDSVNEFSFELFKQILQTKGNKNNIVVSPIGLKFIVSILSKFTGGLSDDFNISMSELQSEVCKIAAGLWINSGIPLKIKIKEGENIFSF